jgi:hypothetical protein
MAAEYEAKVLDIDPAEMSAMIVAKGGQLVGEPALQRRYVCDITPPQATRSSGSGSATPARRRRSL